MISTTSARSTPELQEVLKEVFLFCCFNVYDIAEEKFFWRWFPYLKMVLLSWVFFFLKRKASVKWPSEPWLGLCITSLGVAGSKPLEGSMVESAFHTLDVDQVPGIFRGGSKIPETGNPLHKRGPKGCFF